MKDFKFGNLIYKLRTDEKLTQEDLAIKLGVSNKAISKWENGNAKPTIDTLRKISDLFNIPINELLNTNRKENNKLIKKIVLTGGPCAGKTTAMCWIQNAFTKLGYRVLFIPETATELINGGVSPTTCGSNKDFQKCVLKLQIEKEKTFELAAENMSCDKILIVCDRGAMDGRAYTTASEFKYITDSINSNIINLRDNYDAVFHLVTAAKGCKEYYTKYNNTARYENVDEAILADDKIISAWTGHPHFRVIDNASEFDFKMNNLIKEITSFLGEPEPYEIEKKFLIKYPDIKWLESYNNCKKTDIVQTYLKSDNDDEIRIRQRGIDGNYVYYETIKKKVSNIKRIELERRLSKDEYLSLLLNQDTTKHSIVKTRYCLIYKNQYFEIDIYPFWKDKAIVEIELNDENEKIEFPNKLTPIKEVTEVVHYKNAYLASNEKRD